MAPSPPSLASDLSYLTSQGPGRNAVALPSIGRCHSCGYYYAAQEGLVIALPILPATVCPVFHIWVVNVLDFTACGIFWDRDWWLSWVLQQCAKEIYLAHLSPNPLTGCIFIAMWGISRVDVTNPLRQIPATISFLHLNCNFRVVLCTLYIF